MAPAIVTDSRITDSRIPDSGFTKQPAIAYIRVSESGPSREEQETAISNAAQTAGLEITETLVEVAEIGAGDIVDRRMGLFELLGGAHAGKMKSVVVSGWIAISNQQMEAAIIGLMLERGGARILFADGFDVSAYREQAARLLDMKDREVDGTLSSRR